MRERDVERRAPINFVLIRHILCFAYLLSYLAIIWKCFVKAIVFCPKIQCCILLQLKMLAFYYFTKWIPVCNFVAFII